MKKVARAVAAIVALIAVQATHAAEVYGTVGTDGLGIGMGYSFNPSAAVRADFNWARISHSGESSGVHYDGVINMAHAALYADWFPFAAKSRFRVTAGMLMGDDNVTGELTGPGGTYTFHGHTVSATETIQAKASMPSVRPYLGLGYGHNTAEKGFSFIADAGVAYGKPSVKYTIPDTIVAGAGAENVAAQEADWTAKANRLRFYPVVKVGVAYHY
jgi:hypothetical protein